METQETKAQELAKLRQGIYRWFAACLLYPDEELIRHIPEVVRFFQEQEELLAEFPFFLPWKEWLEDTESKTEKDLPLLQEEYMEVFGESGERKPIPLVESAYLPKREVSALLVELPSLYSQAGLSLSFEGPPDHLAVELEWMSYLTKQEGEHWEDGEKLLSTLEQEYQFVKHHLSRYLPKLKEKVEHHPGAKWYRKLLSALSSFLDSDLDYLYYLIQSMR